MKDQRVALGSGIYYEEPVTQVLGNNARIFTTQDTMFQALARDEVDVVLAALPNGNFWIRELGIPGVRIAGELNIDGQTGEDLRFGVRPGLAPLADIFDQALSAITPEEMHTIESRWLGASVDLDVQETGDVTLNAVELAWLEARDNQINLCIDPDWLPLEGIDEEGNHAGLSAEVARLFSKRAPVRFELVRTDSWTDSIGAARQGKCDIFTMAMKTPERSEFLNFTEPYLEVPTVVLGRIEAPFIDGWAICAGTNRVVKDYAFAELLQSRYPSLNLIEWPTSRQACVNCRIMSWTATLQPSRPPAITCRSSALPT